MKLPFSRKKEVEKFKRVYFEFCYKCHRRAFQVTETEEGVEIKAGSNILFKGKASLKNIGFSCPYCSNRVLLFKEEK